MREYEINKETMAILSVDNNKSLIIEENNEYEIEKKAYSIMDDSCKYFGSSYDGRVEGARRMLGYEYKLPIIVEESNKIIFFPTVSPNVEDCSWISLSHIDKIIDEDGKSVILFKNGRKLSTFVSKASLNNQLLRSTRLESVLLSRKID